MEREGDGQVAAAARFWDSAYAQGRFLDLPPDPMVDRILAAARDGLPEASGRAGVCVGVGNGRNFLPLVDGGLDLVGLDVSAVGLDAIRDRRPDLGDRLVHGELSALPQGERFPVVIGLNVFHHGDRDTAHALIRAGLERVIPGGLFAIRVMAVGTTPSLPHDVVSREADGSVTIRYQVQEADTGPLHSHLFGGDSLAELLDGWTAVEKLHTNDVDVATGQTGRWLCWEGIYRRP